MPKAKTPPAQGYMFDTAKPPEPQAPATKTMRHFYVLFYVVERGDGHTHGMHFANLPKPITVYSQVEALAAKLSEHLGIAQPDKLVLTDYNFLREEAEAKSE